MADQEKQSNFDKLTPNEKVHAQNLAADNLYRAQHDGNVFAKNKPDEYRANALDGISIAKIKARGDGEVLTTRSTNTNTAQQGKLDIYTAPDFGVAIREGDGPNMPYLSANERGVVVSGGVYLNHRVAAQAIMAAHGAMNDGVVDAQEGAALRNFVLGASKEASIDKGALETLKKFEGLEPDARHAILAKAGQLAGKDNMAGYADAALKIAEHFNPNQKDLSGAVEAAAQNLGLPKLAKGKATEL